MRTLLFLVYFFPPYGSVGSSTRAVKFVKYLPRFGWQPVVLAMRDPGGCIPQAASLSLDDVPPETAVHRVPSPEWLVRTPARARLAGAGAGVFAPEARPRRWLRRLRQAVLIPDEQILWAPLAVASGIGIARAVRPRVIVATCPPFSVALAGAWLSARAHLPLIVDVRDDWMSAQMLAHKPPALRRIEAAMEARVVRRACAVVTVTEESREAFAARYPDQAHKFVYIPNGYDPADHPPGPDGVPAADGAFTILHSGSLHGNRSPRALTQAIRVIRDRHPEIARRLRVIFRGDMLDEYRAMLTQPDVAEIVQVREFLPRDQFVAAARSAQVLLVIAYDQAPTLIPAKVYEYWALGRPMLLLAGEGAARTFVTARGLGRVAPLDDPATIAQAVAALFHESAEGKLPGVGRDGLERFDRRALAGELAQLLDAVV